MKVRNVLFFFRHLGLALILTVTIFPSMNKYGRVEAVFGLMSIYRRFIEIFESWLCAIKLLQFVCSSPPMVAPTKSPITAAQLSIDDFEYIGAFRLKDVGDPGLNFAVGVITFNSGRNSLFIVGHAQYQTIAEYPVISSATLAEQQGNVWSVLDLPVTDDPLQNFAPVLDLAKGGSSNTYNPDGLNTITGLLYVPNANEDDGALLFNAEDFYDTFPTATQTTGIVRSAKNLNGTVTQGFYRMQGAAKSAGYMGKIPSEFQSMFGGFSYYTGWSSVYSILSRYSLGPTLWTFDPSQALPPNTPPSNISTIEYLNYAFETTPLSGSEATEWEPCTSVGPFPPSSPLWNPLSRAVFAFFVPGTRAFVAVGSTAGLESGIGYKGTQENGNVCGGPCPYLLSDYYNYYWFFNIDDILAAENAYDPQPYSYGIWKIPYDNNGVNRILGGAIDDSSRTLYLTIENAAKVGDYDQPPLVVAYSLPKL